MAHDPPYPKEEPRGEPGPHFQQALTNLETPSSLAP